METSGLSV